jgi:hypothetical protein
MRKTDEADPNLGNLVQSTGNLGADVSEKPFASRRVPDPRRLQAETVGSSLNGANSVGAVVKQDALEVTA